MDRLTTNKNVSEMGMYELAHNACYSKERLARYRDYEMDMDARDFARNLMTTLVNEDMPIDDELFDEEIIENLIYDPFSDVKGLIALFYRNLWAMADLREKLAEYEDAEEQGLLHKTQVAIGSIVYRINEYAEEPLIPMGVISIEIKGITDTFKEMKCKECVYGGEFTYRFSDIGKTVFLTKEAAKQALEAMKGGGEC